MFRFTKNCALCKRIRLHSAQNTRHTGHSMPP